MKNKKHMDAEVHVKTKAIDSDNDGRVEGNEKRRANEIGDALKKAFGEKKHMKKDEKEESNGLTAGQKKLPPKLQAAILKSKGKKKKHTDEDGDLDNPEKADLDHDGELSSYEKKRGKAIEKAMKGKHDIDEGKKHCGMYMDKDEDGDLDNPEKADLDNDGKLSSYEKKRGKAIEKSMKGEKCSCGKKPEDCTCDHEEEEKDENHWSGRSLPTFQEWLQWRDNQG